LAERTISCAEEVLELRTDDPPQVTIMDLNLPGLSGI